MPYTITTCGRLSDGRLHQWGDPIAVATLDEAREAAAVAIEDAYRNQSGDAVGATGLRAFEEHMSDADAMPESGDTIGPLPDGTVIEVRQVDWPTLGCGMTGADVFSDPATEWQSRIIDAYNAR